MTNISRQQDFTVRYHRTTAIWDNWYKQIPPFNVQLYHIKHMYFASTWDPVSAATKRRVFAVRVG